MGKTIAEKILTDHAQEDLHAGDFAICHVDFTFGQDGTSSIIIDRLQELKVKQLKTNFCMVIDHNSPSPTEGVSSMHKRMRCFSHRLSCPIFDVGCGVCHHDDKGKPLANLKAGDNVQRCIECHKKPSERPKGKGAPKLKKKQRLEYHAEALHYNCKDCHKAFNKKFKTKAAPTTCTKCHPKKKK